MQKHVSQADWTFLENVIRLGLKSNLTSRDEIEKKLRSLRKKIEIAKKEGDLEGLAGFIISKNLEKYIPKKNIRSDFRPITFEKNICL